MVTMFPWQPVVATKFVVVLIVIIIIIVIKVTMLPYQPNLRMKGFDQ